METLFLVVLLIMAIFLILLVLVQRGRGGGLAGAFGGVGGSSAFGAKAGDTFTRITVWAASVWIVTCVVASYWASHRGDALGKADPQTASTRVNLSDVGAGAGESAAIEGSAGEGDAAVVTLEEEAASDATPTVDESAAALDEETPAGDDDE